ncbi:hypothetical protein POTG_02165 [Paenibacillus sp. oral taxon 786 str. D14]|nr:hypothetical protein POTG_02165 [Paenibacillus sp. oral taxon 786 str. D14]
MEGRESRSYGNFNPRTLTGCDDGYPVTPRGRRHFNPRTLTGCDQELGPGFVNNTPFQSTHPYRVRLYCVNVDLPARVISIHAPLQGATHLAPSFIELSSISIHAPLQGATVVSVVSNDPVGFQSTHPYRVRLLCIGKRVNY